MAEKFPVDARPEMTSLRTGEELRRWYWRKSELVDLARTLGLKTTASKFVLLDRIECFLDTGKREQPADQRSKPTSKFDWHGATLSDHTVITDNYRNTQNVRRYFTSRTGTAFKFNIAFMEWMKSNTGKTLADAVIAYRDLKQTGTQSKIKEHNQFNQYTRDFLADNPHLSMHDVRRIWALKINAPSETGRHVYDKADIGLGEDC